MLLKAEDSMKYNNTLAYTLTNTSTPENDVLMTYLIGIFHFDVG